MKRGDISAIIVVPQGLQTAVGEAKAGSKSSVAIQLYTDPAQTQTTQVVQGAVSQIANGFNLAVQGGSNIVTVDQKTLSSTNISTVTYLVPSILAMALMQLGVFAAVPLVQQREKGILKRMGATPLQRWKLVASNILLRLVVAAVDTVLIIGIGIAVFHIQLVGNMAAALGIVFLGAGAFLALGFMLASFLKTEEQATGVVQVVQMPLMFLSGIFFPFDFMPDFLRSVARLLPLTYLGDGLRQTMVNGTQVAPLSVDVLILAGWLVVCLAIAARSFRWE
jgi:ABC-2 type transport system permease protein